MANEYEGGTGLVETYGGGGDGGSSASTPTPPAPQTPAPRSNYSPQTSSPAAPATPPNPFSNLPQYRVSQIEELINQWELLTGLQGTISNSLVANMVNNYSISDIYDVSQYLKQNMGSAWPNMAQQPWAWYGMSATEYAGRLSSFANIWSQLTGTQLAANDGNGNLVDQAMKQYQGQMTESQFQQWLMSNQAIQNTYGWLKYGLNFQQFQQQKLGMTLAFGRTLSDTEGVTQLQYLHSATGPSMAIANQPTFTQQERKQANVGISGSVAR